MKNSKYSRWMFLIGLGSQTQIHLFGSLAISEIFIFIIAPFFLIKNFLVLRKDGVNKYLFLLFLAMIGGCISAACNGILLPMFARGLAAQYSFLASLVLFYIILRKDPLAFRWYILGSAISFVICIFVFQQATEIFLYGAKDGSGIASADDIMAGPIFWIGRLNGFITWPVKAFYQTIPSFASVSIVLFFSLFSILSSASGRSAALTGVLSVIFVVLGGKTSKKLRKLQRSLPVLIFVFVILLFLLKGAYSYAASSGMLGEKAQEKYEQQTAGKHDLLHIIMGGRPHFFMGLYCASKQPLLGYGAWAVDDKGYTYEWLAKYGSYEAYQAMAEEDAYYASKGRSRIRFVPAHSILVGWWIWYGILGVPVWLYTFYLMYHILRYKVQYAPKLFGVVALAVPSLMWSILFSPFGGRIEWGFIIAIFYIIRNSARYPELSIYLGNKYHE